MKPIKFNDTENYEFMEVLGVEGAFSSLRIQRETLPEGFFKYSLRQGENSMVDEVALDVLVDHAGDFIAKEELPLNEDGFRKLGDGDWRFSPKSFDFEGYFGQKLSIDCQIANAEAKKAELLGKDRDMALDKLQHTSKELIDL